MIKTSNITYEYLHNTNMFPSITITNSSSVLIQLLKLFIYQNANVAVCLCIYYYIIFYVRILLFILLFYRIVHSYTVRRGRERGR